MTAITVYEGADTLYGALSFPLDEERVEDTLKRAARIFGVQLVGVWEYESCWGLAGFTAVRIVHGNVWRQAHPALMDHLRGVRPLQPGQSITGPTCDSFSAGSVTAVDGINVALFSDVSV